METNCKNCGAPIDLKDAKCAYCGTPYHVRESREETVLYMDNIPIVSIPMYTPNELRRLFGMRHI